jgi:hypothetical protein
MNGRDFVKDLLPCFGTATNGVMDGVRKDAAEGRESTTRCGRGEGQRLTEAWQR